MTRAADKIETTGIFDNALAVSGAFAIRWNPSVLLDAAAAVVAETDNVQLLLAEASMDESPGSEALKDESPHLALELHRIELKLNVLLKIAGELLAREHHLPAPRLGRLSATGLDCAADPSFKVGDRGTLELYINRSLPYSLRFNAAIDAERTHNGVRMAHFKFDVASESFSDHMAKFIFRKHRRLIAIAKQA